MNIFEAIKKLKSHNFPGNVRELKSTIELACVLSNNSLITKDDIQYYQPTKNKINLDENKSLDEVTAEIIQSSILKNKNNII